MQSLGRRKEQARVKKHRAMREGKGFQTIEAFHTLDDLRLPEKGSLMLECMSNLLANEQFELGGTDEEILDRIQQGIQNLKEQTDDLIIVTNEIFSDGCRYDAETVRYIRLLGNLNIRMAEEAGCRNRSCVRNSHLPERRRCE